MTKIVLLSKIPSPYRTPLFAAIDAHPGVELVCAYLAMEQPNRLWKVPVGGHSFREVVLPGRQFMVRRYTWPVHLNQGVWALLRREQPDAIVVSGYESAAYWQALAYARLARCRFVLWSGAIRRALHVTRGPVDFMRRTIIRRADRLVAYGSAARALLIEYGAAPQRIEVGLNTVDMETIAGQVKAQLDPALHVGREHFELLFLGQLIRRKGLDQTLHALAAVAEPRIHLTIVGEGDQRAALQTLAASLGLAQQIEFAGYHQYDALPRFLAAADALIVPSYEEIWGLVVNEGLAAGLPVLASQHAGATRDLIDASNGLVFDPLSLDQTVAAMGEVYARRDQFRQQRPAIMAAALHKASLQQYANAFVRACTG